MKLGKKSARPEAISFKLSQFTNPSALPKPPKNFGHETFIGANDWGMLGNDIVSDCVFAGFAHEVRLWNAECSTTVVFDDKSVISDYSAVTGYIPTNPNTDRGTDMKEAASYRRKTGIVDTKGVRHKVAAYISIEAGSLLEHYQAMYLFGVVGIGIQFPSSAMDQIKSGKNWSVVSKSSIEGGHYIPIVAKRKSLQCVTWGQIQGMTTGFFRKYNDESVCFLSEEMLINRKSPEGFDYESLSKHLNELK